MNDSNPIDLPPIVEVAPGFPFTENDFSSFLWGVNEIRKIFSLSPVSDLVEREIAPGIGITNEDFKNWVRNMFPCLLRIILLLLGSNEQVYCRKLGWKCTNGKWI